MTQPSAFFSYFSYFRKDNRTVVIPSIVWTTITFLVSFWSKWWRIEASQYSLVKPVLKLYAMWCLFLILSGTMLFNMFKIVVLYEFFQFCFVWRTINSLPCSVCFTHCWRLYGNMFLCLIAVFIRWFWVVSSTFAPYLFFLCCLWSRATLRNHFSVVSPSVHLSHSCYIKITFVVVWNFNTVFLSIQRRYFLIFWIVAPPVS